MNAFETDVEDPDEIDILWSVDLHESECGHYGLHVEALIPQGNGTDLNIGVSSDYDSKPSELHAELLKCDLINTLVDAGVLPESYNDSLPEYFDREDGQ
jgi:hypothetical protein